MKHRIARDGALVALIIITLLVGRPALGAATEEQLPTATPTATAAASATQTQTATLPPSATAEPTSTSQPTTTATPGANARPDDCEKNNRREDACPIAVDTVNGPFTFIPEGDQDWYRADLGEPNGLQTTVFVRASGKLDLLVSISRDDGTPLTAYSSPVISTTLAADISGPIIIRVENRAPDDPVGSSYNIEIRKTLPPAPTPPSQSGGTIPILTPDIAENNWNIGWYFTSMFERVYQEKRPVFDLSGQCFSRECSNEKLMYRSHLPLGSDLCRADAHHRNDSIIHRFRRLGKPTSRREQPRSKPFVRRLREMFEDSCEKCSNFRVMYHRGVSSNGYRWRIPSECLCPNVRPSRVVLVLVR